MFQKDKVDCELPPDSVFYKFGEHGLISFSDYMFLLVVLSSKYCKRLLRVYATKLKGLIVLFYDFYLRRLHSVKLRVDYVFMLRLKSVVALFMF